MLTTLRALVCREPVALTCFFLDPLLLSADSPVDSLDPVLWEAGLAWAGPPACLATHVPTCWQGRCPQMAARRRGEEGFIRGSCRMALGPVLSCRSLPSLHGTNREGGRCF